MRRIAITPVLILAAVAFLSIAGADRFEPAEDLPVGALILAETRDLSKAISAWERSETGKKFLESRSFRELSDRRLALRLASRWKEFSEGVGSKIDLAFLRSVSERDAALAVYDPAKLDLVFLTPVSQTVYEASVLFGLRDRFEEHRTDKGTVFYSKDFQADNGRQDEQILFGLIRGRLVVATDRKLFEATEANILGNGNRRSLARDPAYSELKRGAKDGLLTVWIDQQALNKDYYFRRYWTGKDVKALDEYRSGIFSVAIDDGTVTEHRRYLLSHERDPELLPRSAVVQLRRTVPEGAAYFRISSGSANSAASEVVGAMFSDRYQRGGREERLRLFSSHGGSYEDERYDGYYRLDDRFEHRIDEDDERSVMTEPVWTSGLKRLESAFGGGRTGILAVRDPEGLEFPFFADLKRGGAVLVPQDFDESRFRSIVAEIASMQAGAAGQDLGLKWNTERSSGDSVNSLELPMLGREFAYVLEGRKLIFANSLELVGRMLDGGDANDSNPNPRAISEVAVLDLGRGKSEFEEIFGRLNPEANESDFFKGNIASLLAAISAVDRITVETRPGKRVIEKTITFHARPE